MTKKVIILSLFATHILLFLLIAIYLITLAPSLLTALGDINLALNHNLLTPTTIDDKGFISLLLYPLLKACYAAVLLRRCLLNRPWWPLATIYSLANMGESIIFLSLLGASQFLIHHSLLLAAAPTIIIISSMIVIMLLPPFKEKISSFFVALLQPHAIYAQSIIFIVILFMSLLNQIALFIGVELNVSMTLLIVQLLFFILSTLFFNKSIKYSIMFSWIACMLILFTLITLIDPLKKIALFVAYLALSLEHQNPSFTTIDHFSQQIGSITLAITLIYGLSFVAYFFIILRARLQAKKQSR